MSGYPWYVEDKINAALRGYAKDHEVYAVSSHVDRLEHSLRETRSLVDGLRDELSTAQSEISRLVELVAQLCEMQQAGEAR